jgi:hypothetical protein
VHGVGLRSKPCIAKCHWCGAPNPSQVQPYCLMPMARSEGRELLWECDECSQLVSTLCFDVNHVQVRKLLLCGVGQCCC